MKIQTIRPYDGYFIDEVHINIKFPFEKLSRHNRDITRNWFTNFAERYLSCPKTNGKGFSQVHHFGKGITFKKDKHYNYQTISCDRALDLNLQVVEFDSMNIIHYQSNKTII